MDLFTSLLDQLALADTAKPAKKSRDLHVGRKSYRGEPYSKKLCCRCPPEKNREVLPYSPTGLCRECAIQFSRWKRKESKLPSSSLLSVPEFIKQYPPRGQIPCRRCPLQLGRVGNSRGSGLCRICSTYFRVWKKNYQEKHPQAPKPTVKMFLKQSPSFYRAKSSKPLCVRCPPSRKNEQSSSITGLCKDCITLYGRVRKKTGRFDLSVEEFVREHPIRGSS